MKLWESRTGSTETWSCHVHVKCVRTLLDLLWKTKQSHFFFYPTHGFSSLPHPTSDNKILLHKFKTSPCFIFSTLSIAVCCTYVVKLFNMCPWRQVSLLSSPAAPHVHYSGHTATIWHSWCVHFTGHWALDWWKQIWSVFPIYFYFFILSSGHFIITTHGLLSEQN